MNSDQEFEERVQSNMDGRGVVVEITPEGNRRVTDERYRAWVKTAVCSPDFKGWNFFGDERQT